MDGREVGQTLHCMRHRDIDYWGYFFIIIISDVDECSAESAPCDENAECTNSDGSFSCLCKQGFTGDGKTCQGTSPIL